MGRSPCGSVKQVPKSPFPCPARTPLSALYEEFILGEHAGDVPGVVALASISFKTLVYIYFIWRI